MIAQVYFNLHKKSWSIRDSRTYLVTNKDTSTYFVVLHDVTFKVNETARQRVIREKRKNVHAFACGTLQLNWDTRATQATIPISYNPYKAGHFVRTDTGEAVYSCKLLVMSTKLVEIDTGVLKRMPVVKAQF